MGKLQGNVHLAISYGSTGDIHIKAIADWSDVSVTIPENALLSSPIFENVTLACRFLINQQCALCFSSNQTRVLAKVHKWECRIMAITSAFQADDAGSIPVIPSK